MMFGPTFLRDASMLGAWEFGNLFLSIKADYLLNSAIGELIVTVLWARLNSSAGHMSISKMLS